MTEKLYAAKMFGRLNGYLFSVCRRIPTTDLDHPPQGRTEIPSQPSYLSFRIHGVAAASSSSSPDPPSTRSLLLLLPIVLLP